MKEPNYKKDIQQRNYVGQQLIFYKVLTHYAGLGLKYFTILRLNTDN